MNRHLMWTGALAVMVLGGLVACEGELASGPGDDEVIDIELDQGMGTPLQMNDLGGFGGAGGAGGGFGGAGGAGGGMGGAGGAGGAGGVGGGPGRPDAGPGRPDATPRPDMAPPDPCGGGCGANAFCGDNGCECLAGFILEGGACVPAAQSPLEARTAEEVCGHWQAEHQRVSPEWEAGPNPGDQCDPGSVPAAAQANAIRRTNLYRWLVGLEPVGVDEGRLEAVQACAVIIAALRRLTHNPSPNDPCFTQAGASGAGSSNIAGGSRLSMADSVDLYVQDPGASNIDLGHRRWVLGANMGRTAFGYKNNYSCMYSFDQSNRQAVDFIAWPPPGPVPVQAAQGLFSVALFGLSPGQDFRIEVGADGGALMPVEIRRLQGNYGRDRASYSYQAPRGIWAPGREMTVALRGLQNAEDVIFTTSFVDCR